MDNFRKSKHNQRRTGAIDGFISRPVQPDKPTQGSLGSQNSGTGLGNFKSVDGFRPAGRSSLRTTARPTGRQPQRDPSGRIALNMPVAPPRKKRHHWAKVPIKAFSVLMIISVLVGAFLFGKGYLKARQIFRGGGGAAALQDNVDPSKLRGEGDGRVNILMLGKGGLGHEGADLTDTILVASISPIQKEAALLSIPRDFYIKVNGSYTKINAVYSNAKEQSLSKTSTKDSNRNQKAEDAGLKAIEDAVQSSIGIPIHYHVMVDFTGFKEAIDTVGGVDLNVTKDLSVAEQMRIDGRNYYLNVQSGQQHFDGFRALAYARSRHTSPRGDFDRSERQRLILVALKSKVFTAGTYGNPFKINQLINNFGNHIQANMTTDEVVRLYNIGNSIDSSKIASVDLVTPPNNYVTTSFIDGQSVVIPRTGVGNYKEIQSFIRNRLKDGFLANENATVAIYNGTDTPGLAARTADDLKSYGYNISQVADAPTKGYGQTVVVDMRNGAKKYTKHYLENRFSVSSVNQIPDKSIPPGNADFVIILGQNEISRLDN
jgi:polyisoprenyl-teichoic acid--peptidoglycan teichoic acid transferase